MKTKKKEHTPSRFTRGEKVTAKRGRHHGRRSTDKTEETGAFVQAHLNEEVPTV